MASITITVPNDIAVRVLAAFSASYGYEAEVLSDPGDQSSEMIPNPESRAEFTTRMLKRHIKNIVVSYEAREAAKAASQAATDDANTDINLE